MTILLAGDVMLGRMMNSVLKYQPPAFPWGDTLPLFETADIRACNLECVLCDHGRPWSVTRKVFHFRSDAKNVQALLAAGVNLVSLANNHVLDYEYDGLLEMLDLLERASIGYAGAGRNRTEACRAAAIEVEGRRLGFLAFTDNEPFWEATDDRPGIWYTPIDLKDERARMVLSSVTQARDRFDFLIVSAHWGPNWGYEPPPEHVSFGRALIDCGADVVFGHSAHVFRGIELYRGRPILYGTGDFVDDYAVDEIERNDESFVFLIHTSGVNLESLTLYPTQIQEFQARLPRPEAAEGIASKMQRLCLKLDTAATWIPDQRCLRIPITG
jgi:poly-gamma-glutamate capsule biosynthesis protein CapA/YwtB (metallophosphatase superfamily)